MKRLTFYCFLLLIFSCNNHHGVPSDVLPIDSMQKIMKDVILADQYATTFIMRDTSKRDKIKANQDLFEIIFKIHHTSKEEFQRSLAFYESKPDLNRRIVDSLAEDGNRRRGEIYMPRTKITHLPPR